ncbi:hypothetical protein B0J13DRAFT_520448 [Dactylonectria estremocensis]|uniref:Uncharacterized protein n=1 Tax=Dactylonectria estremocensis TaxID=1079267 RepID=A0A9P9FBX8_9HYPO|nr:hypothetical protein B0J13DRAFT_520448 [Dactylonectria estremocensis]
MGRPRNDKPDEDRRWDNWKNKEHKIEARPTMDDGTGSSVNRSMPGDHVRLDATPPSMAQTLALPIGIMSSGRTTRLYLPKTIHVEIQAVTGNWLPATATIRPKPPRRPTETPIGVSKEFSKTLGYKLMRFGGHRRTQHTLPNGDVILAGGTIPLPFKTADGGQVTEHVAVWARPHGHEVPFQILLDPTDVERFVISTALPTTGDGADDGAPAFWNCTSSAGPSSDFARLPQDFLRTFVQDTISPSQGSGTANDSPVVVNHANDSWAALNHSHYQGLGSMNPPNLPTPLRSLCNIQGDEHAGIEMDPAGVFPYSTWKAATPLPSFQVAQHRFYPESQAGDPQLQLDNCQNLQLGGAMFGSYSATQAYNYEASQTDDAMISPFQPYQSPQGLVPIQCCAPMNQLGLQTRP